MRKRGRPTLFRAKMIQEAEALSMLGLTEENLATFWKVSSRALARWKKKEPEFRQAIEKGKLSANITVSRRLFESANQGSLGAMIFWLTNRMPELWADKRAVFNNKIITNVEGNGSLNGEHKAIAEQVRNDFLRFMPE